MIKIKRNKITELNKELKNAVLTQVESTETDLEKDVMQNLNNIFSDSETISLMQKMKDFNNNKPFSYEQLCDIQYSLNLLDEHITHIKNKVELDIFLKDGYRLDLKKFKEKFDKKKLHLKFPNFNFQRLEELYKSPPKRLCPYYSDKEYIIIDNFVFRKILIGIIQMVLDHMDILIAITGGEGTGKSTHVSQWMYITHWILRELHIVEYKFKIEDCFFNTLEKLRSKEDDFFEEPFRIFCLDEGNQLHRQNWKDEEVQTFFQRLRRERHNQRIKFICIPVLGELMLNIILSRVNFVIEMVNTNEMKTGSLNKGQCNFYILPRGEKIYSPAQKKEIYRSEIKQKLYENMKDKNYLTGMPREILIKRYRCNGVWGFPEKLYIKELKETNKTFTVKSGLKLSDLEAFYLYKSKPRLKTMGINVKDAKYATLNKFLNRLNNYFEQDPDKYKKYELILQRKEEERKLKT